MSQSPSQQETPTVAFSDVPEVLEDLRQGKMAVLVDAEDRENEGDLICAAEKVTPEIINFMAKYGRGLICLSLTGEKCDELALYPQALENTARFSTAFTVSIDAAEGVTTGISAPDRAHTVRVAIADAAKPRDLARPGHIFPLRARAGGVLVRAGQTEGAVDLAGLAGLKPAAVICEIMNEDGSMARLDDLIAFARKHDLKIGTIRDLIEYRSRNDHLVERISERAFESDYGGQWRLMTYRNKVDGSEAYVIQKGHVVPGEPTLTRVRPISIFDDLLGQSGPRKRTLQRAMKAVGEHGSGVIVLITARYSEVANRGPDHEHRNVGIGSQILADLNIHDMILLSNSQPNVVAIEGYGLNIVDHMPIPD